VTDSLSDFVGGTFSPLTDWDYIRIGGFGANDSERWGGKIAQVLIYHRALSGEEMQQIFIETKERFGL